MNESWDVENDENDEPSTYPVDRTDWPPGPWDWEPDVARADATGRGMLLALRNPSHGAWNGYAGVPPGHCFHGLAADHQLPADTFPPVEGGSPWTVGAVARAHGGLTYAGPLPCRQLVRDGIVSAGEGEMYWFFGFDCHHAYDAAPTDSPPVGGWVYRDLGFVQEQCVRIGLVLFVIDKYVKSPPGETP